MRANAHISVVPGKVRGRDLVGHAAGRAYAGRAFIVCAGIGWPRLRFFVCNGAVEGFCEAMDERGGLRGMARLERAMERARAVVAQRTRSLIEQEMLDAAAVAILIDGGQLHLLRHGSMRVYLRRGEETRRLTPRDEPRGGLLGEPAFRHAEVLDPDDSILAGTTTAFSTESVARITAVLEQDPSSPPSVLATLLTEPAEEAGVGAAAVAMRTV